LKSQSVISTGQLHIGEVRVRSWGERGATHERLEDGEEQAALLPLTRALIEQHAHALDVLPEVRVIQFIENR
jgi:hypothetical protein